MQDNTTLFKIQRSAASGFSISVKHTKARTVDRPHLLFCGGFHSTMDGIKAQFLHNLALQNDWSLTRFDYLGHGSSDGEAEHCSLTDWLDDALAVIDSIPSQLILIGSSMGAWLATHAALQRHTKIDALVTIAAAPDFTTKLLWPAMNDDQKTAIEKGQCISVSADYDGDDWRIRKTLFESGRTLSLLDETSPLDIKIPIRMLHGTNDLDVPWSLSQQLLARFTLSVDATLTLISGGDHRLSDAVALRHLQHALHESINHDRELN